QSPSRRLIHSSHSAKAVNAATATTAINAPRIQAFHPAAPSAKPKIQGVTNSHAPRIRFTTSTNDSFLHFCMGDLRYEGRSPARQLGNRNVVSRALCSAKGRCPMPRHWSGHSAAVHFAYPRVLWGSESHLRRRARPGQQVELKQTRSGIVDEIFDACPRRPDLRPRARKSVQTKPAFA